MVDSELGTGGVSDAYACAIHDGAYGDPEIMRGYSAGFSCAVVARAIREARRQQGLPSAGSFLGLCVRHRARFKQWSTDMLTLTQVRYDAEDSLELQTPLLALTHDYGEQDIPF
jgi:hypothetical protein